MNWIQFMLCPRRSVLFPLLIFFILCSVIVTYFQQFRTLSTRHIANDVAVDSPDFEFLQPPSDDTSANPFRQVICTPDQCSDCSSKVQKARQIVHDEIRRTFKSLPKCKSQNALVSHAACYSCKPRLRTIDCSGYDSTLHAGAYSCRQNLVIEEYDYETQHQCLLSIAHSTGRQSVTRVPRIAHANYFYNGSEMRFHEYLSVISVVRHANPTVFFFWNDALPIGRWWIELLVRLHSVNRSSSVRQPFKFYSIYRTKVKNIYGNAIWKGDQQSDVARIEALLLYGGVYLDLDAFAIRDLSAFFNYSWVMGYERLKDDPSRGWLDKMYLLNNGVLLGESGADFAVLWHHTYKSYYGGEQYAQHSIVMPHTLAESCPHLIHREPRAFNYPNNINTHLLYGDGVHFNLSTNYVVHSWFAQNKRVVNPETIERMNYTMGRIWRYLYHAAAFLPPL